MSTERKKEVQKFKDFWLGKGYEKGESHTFWVRLFQQVLGVEEPERYISFEHQVVKKDTTGYIDAYIPSTKVLIEQKGEDKHLEGSDQTSESARKAFEQAKQYIVDLPVEEHPNWIVTCNFQEFDIYDMHFPQKKPEVVFLKDLPKEYHRLSFLIDKDNDHTRKEMELSIKAGEIVGQIYDALAKEYPGIRNNPDNPDKKSVESLNKLCVRLVFCLYAEDAEIFKQKNQFHDYLNKFPAIGMKQALKDLFEVLDTPKDQRDTLCVEPEALEFEYVNGGLFSDRDVIVPTITEEIRNTLLKKASDDFNWAGIHPAIFGAVFESTLNPETRRSGGMHYTSRENIHKVIDPLFLNDLERELLEIKELKQKNAIDRRVREYQKKLSSLTFMDPAAGSGNFLTETYLSLRRLENDALRINYTGQSFEDPIKVSISQFYGIEINDFAVSVAKTALWIAESQMKKETEDLFGAKVDLLPLTTIAHIHEGNALTMDWNDVIPANELNYIMGNPPFVGYFMQSPAQKEEIMSLYVDDCGKPLKDAGKIDYVAGWYMQAVRFIQNTHIKVAFVSTNSVTQGTMASAIWGTLVNKYKLEIIFAHRTFVWGSESLSKAAVHCVIIGFCCFKYDGIKFVFDSVGKHRVSRINQYLVDNDYTFVYPRTDTLCNVPQMSSGGKPVDGGFLILTDDEKCSLVKREPQAEKYIKRFMGSADYINSLVRWCIWLVDCPPEELRSMPLVLNRVKAVREFRLASKKEATRKAAITPARFVEIKNTGSRFIVVPEVSSERRRYIPMGYLDNNTILSNGLRYIPDASLYELGVLQSIIHMSWVRTVCGRLKSDYDYSVNIVYNNFPWPEDTKEPRKKIEQTAQGILNARALYPNSSLADLYDPLLMPVELRRAHEANDKAVMDAYGFDPKTFTEADCVAKLMTMYQEFVAKRNK